MDRDPVDDIIEQWNTERPDVDVSGMAIIGRISQLERLIRPKLNKVFAIHDLESWEFDVLATLRRSGDPFRLSAGQLLDSMMITSGTMTNRIDRLEKRGFVHRVKDPDDGRVVLAALTTRGKATIDAALVDHAANEKSIVASLASEDRLALTDILRRFNVSLRNS